MPRSFNGETVVFPTSDTKTIRDLHERNWTFGLHHMQKLTQKWIKDLNVRTKNRKLLEENTGVKSRDLALVDFGSRI